MKLGTVVLGPTFALELSAEAEEVVGRLERFVGRQECAYEGAVTRRHAQLTVQKRDRHFWSPHLSLDVREQPHGSLVFGRFNPSPGIWTGFMLTSLAIVTSAGVGLIWACAQVMLDQPPTAAWSVLVGAVLLVLLWAFSAAGQRLAAREMQQMRDAVEQVCLGSEPESSPVP